MTTITKPIDGVNQWDAIVAAARGDVEQGEATAPPRSARDEIRGKGSAPSNRTFLVIGNSTQCSWAKGDPRFHGAAGVAEAFARGGDVPPPLVLKPSLGCGFSIRLDGGVRRWKLIQNYGGGPNDWCNSTKGGAKVRIYIFTEFLFCANPANNLTSSPLTCTVK